MVETAKGKVSKVSDGCSSITCNTSQLRARRTFTTIDSQGTDMPFFAYLRVKPMPSPLRPAKTARGAIDFAYKHYDKLPILAEHLLPESSLLFEGPFADELKAVPSVAITAEKIPRVQDVNRTGYCRVGFFMYRSDGTVVRFHPGRNAASTMTPHVMAADCPLFDRRAAMASGVGEVLHVLPPGVIRNASVPQPGGMLCSKYDLGCVATYDAQMTGWKTVRDLLDALDKTEDLEEYWSNGAAFPWWLWLANTGRTRTVVDDGVLSFKVGCRAGSAFIEMRCADAMGVASAWATEISEEKD